MDNQEELYSKFLTFTNLMLEEYDAVQIAAVMSVIALSMYKTCLDEDGFEEMVDKISDSRDDVKPFSSGGLLN